MLPEGETKTARPGRYPTMRLFRRTILCSFCLLISLQAGCREAAEPRVTAPGESRAALMGVEDLQRALDRPHLADLVAAIDEGDRIRHELADGTRVLITRDRGHVVAIIDDDGDMPADATGPDGDSDCLAVDMDADGSLDRTIDYDDLDADGRADQMVQTYTVQSTWGRRPFMVIARDFDAGPLRLWSLRDYGYTQRPCQWDCDFGGDGWFAMFRRSGGRWIATLECPFNFYDLDGDARAEETVRIIAEGTRLHSARYSINADNDRTGEQLYDYDVSVTCLGSVGAPRRALERLTHRSGDRVGPMLRWESVRETARAADWERCLLIWDENDHNVAARKPGRERWEGILNASFRGFPQEGGPPTLRANKRFELDADFSGEMRLYWWPADGRLHLYGAEQGAIDVDYDYDDATDLHIEYADTDEDGFFDRRTVSYPRTDLPDRTIDGPREYTIPGKPDGTTIPLDYEAISPFWPEQMAGHSQAAADLLTALGATADRLDLPFHCEALDFYETATADDFACIDRLRASAEAERYYRELTVELAFAHLIADAPEPAAERLREARERWDAGDAAGAVGHLSTAN